MSMKNANLFNNLISVTRQHSNTKIVISAILPRPLDHTALGKKVKEVNRDLKSLCKDRHVQFLHTFRPFLKKLSANKRVVRSE